MNTKLKSERQDWVLEEVRKKGPVTVPELAAKIGVSEITIRRDLDELHQGGHLERVRGGARPITPRGPESPVIQRQTSQINEKQAIAAAAASLINDGDVIGIESGSTTMELARAIARCPWQNLQVVTNGFPIAEELMRVPGIQLVIIGGFFKVSEMGTFGVLAEDMLERMRFNKLFIGCRGIDPEIGITNDLHAEMEVATVRSMAAASDQVIVLADYTKFCHTFLLHTLSILEVDTVVTDDQAPEIYLEKLRNQDTQVVVASVAHPEGELQADSL